MFAVGMFKGQSGVRDFEIQKPEIKKPDEVLIRVKEVGLDGTDFNIVRLNNQDIDEGRDTIVLGHEGVGIVETIGANVKTISPGDIVAVTVRRGCGQCQPCLHNQSDMCMTGLFTERGIHKVDGLLTEFIVDQEQYVVKVPEGIEKLAVLTEPLSIAEKAIEELRIIQSRLPWFCPHSDHDWMSKNWGGCKVGLVVGAGPLGLLVAVLMRLAKTYTYVGDILPEDHLKVHMINDMGAHYIDVRGKTPGQIVDFCCTLTGELNIILEASGAAEEAVRLIPYMSRSSIYTMTGIPTGDLQIQLDAAQLVRNIVRYNQVIVGSVNSNRHHFDLALRDMSEVRNSFPGVLGEMLKHRIPIRNYQTAFETSTRDYIKTIIEVEPW